MCWRCLRWPHRPAYICPQEPCRGTSEGRGGAYPGVWVWPIGQTYPSPFPPVSCSPSSLFSTLSHYRDTMTFSVHLMELGRQGSNPRSAICLLCDLRQVTPPLCAFIFVYKKGIMILTSLDYVGALMKHTPGLYRCAENVNSSTSSHSVSFSDFTLPYLFWWFLAGVTMDSTGK